MKFLQSSVLAGLLLVIFQSCGPGRTTGDNQVLRPATDVPALFEPPAGMNWGDNTCKNPIIDPLDGSELILIQSQNGMGDYKVNGRKYGIAQGELLRINCNTGAVVGIVRG